MNNKYNNFFLLDSVRKEMDLFDQPCPFWSVGMLTVSRHSATDNGLLLVNGIKERPGSSLLDGNKGYFRRFPMTSPKLFTRVDNNI